MHPSPHETAALIILHVLRRRIELQIALDDLVHRRQKVLLRRHLAPRPDGEHARLCRHAAQLRARRVGAQARDELPPDVALHRHALGVDAQDVGAPVEIGQRELDFAVDAAGPHEGRVEGRRAVGREHDFDVASRVEAVELGDELEHRPLHFVVAARAVVESCAADGVDFVEEYDAGFFRPGHLEELAHHSSAFSDVLLHEFAADDSDEGGVCSVCYGSCAKSLSCAGRSVEKSTFWRVDAKIDEALGGEKRHFDNFTEFFDLFFAAADVAVGYVGLVFDCHHCNAWVYLGREGEEDFIFVPVDSANMSNV